METHTWVFELKDLWKDYLKGIWDQMSNKNDSITTILYVF